MELSQTICKYVLGKVLVDDLPTIAMQAIDAGFESPSLYQLAGSQGRDAHYIRVLFSNALDELGMSMPSPVEAGLNEAKAIAKDVLSGNVAPYDGAKRIWSEVYTKFPELTQLTSFVGLASEYEDDEYHRSEYEQMIMSECKTLVQ